MAKTGRVRVRVRVRARARVRVRVRARVMFRIGGTDWLRRRVGRSRNAVSRGIEYVDV